MSLLLDTHVFLWAVLDPRKLSAKIRAIVEDPDTELVVSAASAWEFATKYRLGRLPGAAAVAADYEGAIRELRARPLPVRNAHALRAGSYPHAHADPIDRMLVAQAEIEGLPLVSKDRVLRQFGIDLLW